MVIARLSELSHAPKLAASLAILFPSERLDAFFASSGVDLRRTSVGLAAGFDFATLLMAATNDDGAAIESKFAERIFDGPSRHSSRPDLTRVAGSVGQAPETLVRAARRFVALSIGDPSPARIAELYAQGRLTHAPTALRGSALSTLPPDLEASTIRFYAPGPFTGAWSDGARGLLGSALAVGIAATPEADTLRVRAVFSGSWNAFDVARLESAWTDIAASSLGRLLGLDQPIAPPEVSARGSSMSLTVRIAARPLVNGLRAAVAADVWEILGSAPQRGGASGHMSDK